MVQNVGTTTSTSCCTYPNQKKCFYANGRYYVFYYDGTNFGYKHSTDGVSWSSFIQIYASIHTIRCDTWYDVANNKICVARVGAGSHNVYYRQGTVNADGTITWDSDWVTVCSDQYTYEPKVCKDSNGYPWISYQAKSGADYLERVVKATTTSGSAWGTPTTLWTNRASGSEGISIVPLTGGKMLAVSSALNLPFKSKLYDGSWGSEVSASVSSPNAYHAYDVIADGDNVHLLFSKTTTYTIVYVKYTYGTGWGSEEQVDTSSINYYHPCITLKQTDMVRCIYIKDSSTVKYRDRNAGTWGTITDVASGEASVTCVQSSYKTQSNKMCVTWKSGSSSPYNVRWQEYDIPTISPPTVTTQDATNIERY